MSCAFYQFAPHGTMYWEDVMFADGNIRLVMDMESWEKIGMMAGWRKSSSMNIHKLTTRISGWKLDRYPMLTFEGTVTVLFTDGHPDGRDDGGGPEIERIDPVDVNAVKKQGKFKIGAYDEFWSELEYDLRYSVALWDAMLEKAEEDRRGAEVNRGKYQESSALHGRQRDSRFSDL